MSNVIIIGGSSGLGNEISSVGVENGANVLSFSRHTDPSIDLASLTDESISALLNHTPDMTHLFLAAGVGYQGDLSAQSLRDIDTIIKTAITGPLQLLSKILAQQRNPLHVVTITSTTSFKARDNETAYGAAKAGQAQMARNMHFEMLRHNPKSKSTLIHPKLLRAPQPSSFQNSNYQNQQKLQ